MHTSLRLIVALTTLALSSLAAFKPAAAVLFSRAEVDQSKFIAVASPYGNNAHQLLIIEQLTSARPCWSESGAGPTTINPLLTQFDFTGICGRSIDSNGYSIRMADQDMGWRYSVRIVRRNGDLLLVGAPSIDRKAPELQIGRANGMTNGFAKISLNPGWRITKRVYNGQNVGHIYLTNDQPLTAIAAAPVTPAPVTSAPVTPVTPAPVTPVTPLPKPPAKPSIPIRVPLPESPIGSKPTLPAPPTVTTPVRVTPPATGSKPTLPAPPTVSTPGRVTPPATSSRPTLPAPPTVTKPIPTQPPTTGSRPTLPAPPSVSTPAPVKPPAATPTPQKGDFVVPTMDVYP